jgi:hypothetical protein
VEKSWIEIQPGLPDALELDLLQDEKPMTPTPGEPAVQFGG